MIQEELSFKHEQLGDLLSEFYNDEDLNIFRVTYIESQKSLYLSFNVTLTTNEAIRIAGAIYSKYPGIKIIDEYYVDVNDTVHLGIEAWEALEADIVNTASNALDFEEYSPKDLPIILVSNVAIFHAKDPRVKDVLKAQEERRRLYGRFKWRKNESGAN